MAGQSLARIDPKEFRTFLEGRRGALERISGKLINPDKVVQTVLLCFTKNPALMSCSRSSILRAVLQSSEMGLTAGNPNEAHLVPFGTECTLVPDYRGLVKLALDSDYIVSVEPWAVFEGDEFRVIGGMHPNLIHNPGKCRDPKKMTDVYVVWQTKHGTRHFDYMTVEEVDAIRNRSKAKTSGPWVSDYVAMAKKTVIKRASKMWPKSKAFEKAIALENAQDTGDYSLTEFELPEAQSDAAQEATKTERVNEARKTMRREPATVNTPAPAVEVEPCPICQKSDCDHTAEEQYEFLQSKQQDAAAAAQTGELFGADTTVAAMSR